MVDRVFEPLSREDVIRAVERRHPSRVPLVFTRWWAEELRDQYGERLRALERYPEDAEAIWLTLYDVDKMGLSWKRVVTRAYDSSCVIDDWAKLDEFVEKLPDPENDPQFEALAEQANRIRAAGRYLLCGWWKLFFERPWALRGMENLLADYYEHPEEVHRLHAALADLYCRYLRTIIRELHPDGFCSSDDLGHQTQPMMRAETFREFLKPYYSRVGEVCREHHVHFWLHSCGNNTPLLEDLIESGLTVFHPVQKGTMAEVAVAREFGDRLTFLAGIDVQHTLQEQGPEGVRQEVRFLIDTFDRPDGGMCIAVGNSVVLGTPLENIEAFLDEAVRYGEAHRQRVNSEQ